jgi:hypothetical protein
LPGALAGSLEDRERNHQRPEDQAIQLRTKFRVATLNLIAFAIYPAAELADEARRPWPPQVPELASSITCTP